MGALQADRDDTAGLAIDPTGWSLLADPIWVFDLDGHRMVWANDAALAFWRAASLDELRARDFGPMSDVTRSRLGGYGDRFALGQQVEATWTLYPGNVPVTVRCRCRGVPLTEGGRAAMMVHVIDSGNRASDSGAAVDKAEELREARDQLAQAEARFRAFAKAGADWLWETNEQHQFVYYSYNILHHYGYSLEHLLGITRLELIARIGADPDTPQTREKWARHAEDLAAHRSFRNLEYAFRWESEEIRHASISGDPVFDHTGRFLGYRGVGRDVTAAVVAAERARSLRHERDIAVTANSVMNQFLATMSHELRTPLNAIIGFSEILSGEMFGALGNDTYRGYSTDIFASAQHLLAIVNDLLDLSRLELLDQEHSLERISAGDLASEILAMVRGLAERRQLTLIRDVPVTGLELEVDRRGLKQVAINLLSNAIKFTEPGGTVSFRLASADDGGVEIVVRDTGVGMSEQQMATIFKPFHNSNPHVARATIGSGLGLWICKRMVDAYGGELRIDSVPGAGTTAIVRLPASCDVSTPAPAAGSAGVGAAPVKPAAALR